MGFNFPNTPNSGDTSNGYTWDGQKWTMTGGGGTPSNVDPSMDSVASFDHENRIRALDGQVPLTIGDLVDKMTK